MAFESLDISRNSDQFSPAMVDMIRESVARQFSLAEKVRLLSEMLLRAYEESMSNEGVVTFGSMTDLAASVLEGNSFDTTYFSPGYKQPSSAAKLGARILITELGLCSKHTGL